MTRPASGYTTFVDGGAGYDIVQIDADPAALISITPVLQGQKVIGYELLLQDDDILFGVPFNMLTVVEVEAIVFADGSTLDPATGAISPAPQNAANVMTFEFITISLFGPYSETLVIDGTPQTILVDMATLDPETGTQTLSTQVLQNWDTDPDLEFRVATSAGGVAQSAEILSLNDTIVIETLRLSGLDDGETVTITARGEDFALLASVTLNAGVDVDNGTLALSALDGFDVEADIISISAGERDEFYIDDIAFV